MAGKRPGLVTPVITYDTASAPSSPTTSPYDTHPLTDTYLATRSVSSTQVNISPNTSLLAIDNNSQEFRDSSLSINYPEAQHGKVVVLRSRRQIYHVSVYC